MHSWPSQKSENHVLAYNFIKIVTDMSNFFVMIVKNLDWYNWKQ